MFSPKYIISAKLFLSYCKSNFEKFWFRFYGPRKTLVFYFSVFHFDNFLTSFAKDLMKKPTIFITNIKSTHNFLHFHKDLGSRNFWQWNDALFWKNEKTTLYAFWRPILTNKKKMNSPNLSNMVRGTLILKDCDIASYSCSNYGP